MNIYTELVRLLNSPETGVFYNIENYNGTTITLRRGGEVIEIKYSGPVWDGGVIVQNGQIVGFCPINEVEV